MAQSPLKMRPLKGSFQTLPVHTKHFLSDITYLRRSSRLNSILYFNGATDPEQAWLMIRWTRHLKKESLSDFYAVILCI